MKNKVKLPFVFTKKYWTFVVKVKKIVQIGVKYQMISMKNVRNL